MSNQDGSCSESCKNENTTAHETCTCKEKTISPVIDACQEQLDALIRSRSELSVKIAQIVRESDEKRAAAIKPLVEAIQKTDQMIQMYYRPECFTSVGKHVWQKPSPCVECNHVVDCVKAEKIVGRSR